MKKKHQLLRKTFLSIFFLISGLFFGNIFGQSGAVTFTGSDADNIGEILYDGTHSNDISGIQLNIFCAMTSVDATSRTSAGSFTYWDRASLGGYTNNPLKRKTGAH